MASPTGHPRPIRTLSAFLVLLVATYLLVFFTGDRDPTPKLGVDLQGGTRVTLTARTPDGQAPSQDSLRQAQSIIEQRINGLGVAGSEVIIDGSNLVITVPGQDGARARTLGQTARMFIRPVLVEPQPGIALLREMGAEGDLTVPPDDPGTPGDAVAPEATEPPEGEPQDGQQQPQGRPVPAQVPDEDPAPAPEETPAPEAPEAPEVPLTESERTAQIIREARELRQSDDPEVQARAMTTLDCSIPDPLAGNDDPERPLVTCDPESGYVYLLGPSIIDGTEIDTNSVSSGFNAQQARWEVSFRFKTTGDRVWAQHTRDNLGRQTAFVLDTSIVSAPVIREPTPEGSATSISGNFNQVTAQNLANSLKYGSLPLSFDTSDAQTVSATLGFASLKSGLIAGAVGLVAVLLYSLLYYRALGFLAAGSLLLAFAMVYAILVLLGRYINFTLDLAGVAGLIIGIGMTADSFVVFFERIKDEMREGRSFRSAVPRGWSRAQRTILSGNSVSFIGAAILYVLAVGEVKGFAFTLGLTTLLDLLVVYMVTFPLVVLATRSRLLSDPKYNGLGAITQVAREQQREAAAAGVKA